MRTYRPGPAPSSGDAQNSSGRLLGLQNQNVWYWELHVYGCALAWIAVALYVFVVALNLRSSLSNKWILWRLCMLLCFAGLCRALYLVFDPYESRSRMEKWVARCLFSTGSAALLFSGSFAFCYLFHTTKISVKLRALKSPASLTTVFSVYLFTWLALDMWTAFNSMELLPFVLLLVLIQWAPVLLCLDYLYNCPDMMKSSEPYRISRHGADAATTASSGTRESVRKFLCVKNGSVDVHDLNAVPPKIRITDENDRSFSFKSESGNLTPGVSESGNLDLDEMDDSVAASAGVAVKVGGTKAKNFGRRHKSPAAPQSHQKRTAAKAATSTPYRSRFARMRRVVRMALVSSVLMLLVVAADCFEVVVTRFRVAGIDRLGVWMAVVTISRILELLLAVALALLMRKGIWHL